jgi:hypothetical protein
MIDGPMAEARLWKQFEGSPSSTPGDAAVLRRCFEEEMKPSVSPRQLAAIGEWYLKGEEGQFAVGDQVRVRHGTIDPDYPDLPLGGWAGTIIKIDDGEVCKIALNQQTLSQIHPIYCKRCERDGFDIQILDMSQDDLDPDLGEGLPVEQPTNIVTKPLDPNNQEDRIRAALGVTTDEAVPLVRARTLRQYFEYLQAHLSLPFSLAYRHRRGPRKGVHRISVIGLMDDFIDSEYGVLCEAREGRGAWQLPLVLLELRKEDANYQLITDYQRWFREWGHFNPAQHSEESDDADAQPETPTRKRLGRNDACPCGSGRKFKRCCLRKQNGPSLLN